MRRAPLHPAERQRLQSLLQLGLLDTPREERFDRLTRLAAALIGTPIAAVSLVDDHRQWFKSSVGLDVSETSRDVALCAHAIVDPASPVMVVPDATNDARFADNPLVTGEFGLRFYAGHVVSGPDGMPVGTLCVIDRRARELDADQRQRLGDLAALVEDELAREHADDLFARLDLSERTKTSILHTITEGLVLQGRGGEVIECNPAAERLLGLSEAELRGLRSGDPRWRLLGPDGSDWTGETPSLECLRTRAPVRDRIVGAHRRDGTLVWLQVNAEPVVGPNGDDQCVTVFIDVTERRALERALLVSERWARTALDALEQGVVLAEADGTIRRTNPAAAELLGFPVEEVVAQLTRGDLRSYDEDGALVPPERRVLTRALGGEAVRGELVGWDRPDGERVLLRMTGAPDADGEGSVVLAFTDVTAQHRMVRDLERFRHLFQHADDIIVVIDAAGRVLHASPSASRVLGDSARWRSGGDVLALVHPDDVDAGRALFDSLVAGEQPDEPVTVRVRAHGGEWRHLECVGVNLLHEETVQGIVVTARDTTERERLSAQLAHLAGHDPLTDLPNRSVLEQRLAQCLARADRGGGPVGLCFIDLDGFKQVNDTHGHACGDSVLREVADRLRVAIRGGDTAARVGGDEFVVILDPVPDEPGAIDAARRIRDVLAAPPVQRGSVTVGASIGVAVGRRGETPAALLQRADAALYEAKRRGGSSVRAAAPGPLLESLHADASR